MNIFVNTLANIFSHIYIGCMSKRDNYIRLTLSDSEKKVIEAQANKDGIRVAEWCRSSLLTMVKISELRDKNTEALFSGADCTDRP